MLQNISPQPPDEMKLIGYTCPYIPVELLSATGFRPYCLLHGDIRLSQEGEKYLRIDACPLVRSNLAYVLNNQDRFAAIVGSTGCDMSRRMFDVVDEMTNIPVYVLHNPRTDNPNIYYDEIDWLKRELEHFSDKDLSDDILGGEIEKWEKIREQFRVFDSMRAAYPSSILTSHLHGAAVEFYKGNTGIPAVISKHVTDKPRVYLIGSEISYESHILLALIEQELQIVGDFNCGISQFASIAIEEKNVNALKHAYYNQPPSIFKRPNRKFYDYIHNQLKTRACAGIIAWTLDYCDSYEFELRRMEKNFGLPLLKIRSDFSFQNTSQLKTRITAFKEMLCSTN